MPGTRASSAFRSTLVANPFGGISVFTGAQRTLTSTPVTIYWINVATDVSGEWFQIFDTAVLPANGFVPRLVLGRLNRDGKDNFFNLGPEGLAMQSALGIAVSSSINPLTVTLSPALYAISLGMISHP